MSVKITLNTKDFDDFTKALAKESKGLKKSLIGVMTSSAIDIQSTAKKPGYVPYKFGNLRRSITHDVDVTATGILAIIGSNLDYAAIHEFGDESRGIKESRYIQRAIEDNAGKIEDRIKRAIAAHLLK